MHWCAFRSDNLAVPVAVVYRGTQPYRTDGIRVIPWELFPDEIRREIGRQAQFNSVHSYAREPHSRITLSAAPVYHYSMKPGLDRETIILALRRLSELLRERNVQGEICLLGGTAMVLAFNARERTKDVDAVFQPPQLVRELTPP